MRALVSALIILITSICLAGCATLGTFNPATGKKEFIGISTSSEVKMGEDVHSEIIQKNKLSNDIEASRRISFVGDNLTKVSDRKDYEYNFYLLEEDTINAFTSAGGNIYMFKGLYDKLETDDEIAAVLAHEVGHCAAKHVIKKIQTNLGYNVLSSLLLRYIKVGDKEKKNITYATNSIASLVMLGYSREDEYLADKLSVKYMYLAGYDPGAVIKTLEMLKENSKGAQGPVILRSHPYLDDRIARVKLEIDRIGNI